MTIKRSLLALCFSLFVAVPAHADIVTIRSAFPATQEGPMISSHIHVEILQPFEREAELLQKLTRRVNSGELNIVEIETTYANGYLIDVKMTRIEAPGAGNSVRIAIITRNHPGGISPDMNERVEYVAKRMPKEDLLRNVGIMDLQVDKGSLVAREIFYREVEVSREPSTALSSPQK